MFPVVVSGVEVAHGEPEPGIFLEAASRLGVVPGQCVVVEDSRNGLLAAKRAGMRCVAVPSPPTRTQSFTPGGQRVLRYCGARRAPPRSPAGYTCLATAGPPS
ncbi:MAG: HAD-IA family hydrolase [Candidatus Rokubacteria bacterium]|nr:HAD-IA family hydrolase [Candidatus Rokubacteria bacterium]